MVQIRPYDPINDAGRVLALWEQALGTTYPVSERVFLAGTSGRSGYEPGDGLVAAAGKAIVGFALLQVPRRAEGLAGSGSVAALMVRPSFQRRGIGTALLQQLEAHARATGCTELSVGMALDRFWTGIPADLPAAGAFFAKHGYVTSHEVWDLVVPLRNYAAQVKYQARLTAVGARVVSATPADLGALLAFEHREFAGWVPSLLRMAAAGDLGNALIVWKDDEIVGTIQTFTPASRWRYANLVWERIHGSKLGGYGAVGIARNWRGKGLGAAMCEAAALHVERQGGDCCYIDWTGLVDFYRKVGAQPWRKFGMASRKL